MTFKYPLVAVTWDDAHGTGATTEDPKEVPHRPMRITTFGRAVKVDEVGITIAGEVCEDGMIRNRTFIPKSMIVDVTRLRAFQPRQKKAPPPVKEEEPQVQV